MQLSYEDIQAIAQEVARILNKPDEMLTMEEAAKEMKLNIKTKASLAQAFSNFANPKKYKNPLTAYRIGRQRTFKRSDVMKFMENRMRN